MTGVKNSKKKNCKNKKITEERVKTAIYCIDISGKRWFWPWLLSCNSPNILPHSWQLKASLRQTGVKRWHIVPSSFTVMSQSEMKSFTTEGTDERRAGYRYGGWSRPRFHRRQGEWSGNICRVISSVSLRQAMAALPLKLSWSNITAHMGGGGGGGGHCLGSMWAAACFFSVLLGLIILLVGVCERVVCVCVSVLSQLTASDLTKG